MTVYLSSLGDMTFGIARWALDSPPRLAHGVSVLSQTLAWRDHAHAATHEQLQNPTPHHAQEKTMDEANSPHPRIAPSGRPGNAFEEVMSHCPDAMGKWWDLEVELRFHGLIDSDIKEEIRRAMAPEVGCAFCASLAPAKETYPSRRESLAVAYALMLARDPQGLDDSTFDVLREEFTEPEIVELTMWSLFMVASQAFGAALRVPPAEAEEKVRYAESRKAQLT